MVRNIISVLLLYNEGTLQLEDIKEMLETQKKVIEYAPSPASGLYLKEIVY